MEQGKAGKSMETDDNLNLKFIHFYKIRIFVLLKVIVNRTANFQRH